MNKLLFCVNFVSKARKMSMLTNIEDHNIISNFKSWKFHDPPSYLDLPIDDNPDYTQRMAVNNAVFSKVPPEPIPGKIRLVCTSDVAMKNILNLDPGMADSDDFIDFVSGRSMPEGALTVSHRYGGYQFGYWSDQLGDGRAHILGEFINSSRELWQLQLKGSGETPYSRFGDGRAVLRSSIREMVASEACFFLGIPTTRAAALVASDEPTVWRDKNYCGRSRLERSAVVLRLAPCWYRFGSFEILFKRKEYDLLRTLCDFIIKVHFPEIDSSQDDKYVKWFETVARRNLDMVATWQGFGFTHGVLNTDNMSVLGLTIDYGPFGFLDHYYDGYVPNTSDDLGRYAYKRQPDIVLWNISKLYTALEPILDDKQKSDIKNIISGLKLYVDDKILNIFRAKLGLISTQEGDNVLINEFLRIMADTTADFTVSFRQLSEVNPRDLSKSESLNEKWSLSKMAESKLWDQWVTDYQARLSNQSENEAERVKIMSESNPVYIPRNWMLEEAIKAAENNDFEKVRFLLKVLQNPYQVDQDAEERGYSSAPPSWSFGLKLSCSS